MAGLRTDPHILGSRHCLVLLVLPMILAGCGGSETGEPPSTVAAGAVVTVAATRPAPAIPTATITAAVPTASSTAVPDTTACATGVELLEATDALDKVSVEGNILGGLSALARRGDSTTYYALSDRGGWVYTLAITVPGDPTITAAVQLRDQSGEPYADGAIDGEGLAVLPNGELLVASEVEPSIRHYTTNGEYVADLPVPDRFRVQPEGQAIGNASFESLTLSPSGRLITAVEQPLAGDGMTDDGRGRIRILRYDVLNGTFQPVAEYLYLAEPDQGISEIVAVSDTELLVLERGLSFLAGFSARVFLVTLDGAADVSTIDRLADADVRPASKKLLVDVADCPSGDSIVGGSSNPLLENFESMALGPQDSDGRQVLVVGSDDNFQSFQVTRFLVFAIDPNRFKAQPPSGWSRSRVSSSWLAEAQRNQPTRRQSQSVSCSAWLSASRWRRCRHGPAAQLSTDAPAGDAPRRVPRDPRHNPVPPFRWRGV